MLICIFAVAIASIFATVKDKLLHVSVCINGTARCLPIEDAKKIVKLIKDSGLKVQAAIMDDIIRITGKKIDDLQEVIQASKGWDLGLALQYVNMKN